MVSLGNGCRMVDLRTLWNITDESFRSLLQSQISRRRLLLPCEEVSPEEAGMAMAGDDLIPAPDRVLMRAVTIAAPAGEVWPWLAQMMRGGGIYGWPPLESASCASAEYLLPQLSPPKHGDRVGDLFTVASIDAPRSIVWLSCGTITVLGVSVSAMSLSYRLTALSGGGSRLVVRQWCRFDQCGERLVRQFSNLIHFLLPCPQLRSIRDRAEAAASDGATTRRSIGVQHQAAPFQPVGHA
jgi:hypothetical protein